MQEWDLLSDLKAWRDGRDEESVLLSALRQALALLRGLTGLSSLPPELAPAALELACLRLNRRGTEGEASRKEGAVGILYDALSPEAAGLIRRFTAARAGFPDAS